MLLRPNLDRADELVLNATRRKYGPEGNLETRSSSPGLSLAELLAEYKDGPPVPSPHTGHYGKVAVQLAQLVYDLMVHSPNAFPCGLCPKCVWVVDVGHPVALDSRNAYLAISVEAPNRQAVLMPLPELPDVLLTGRGTTADTRDAVREFAVDMADLVNLALPIARSVAAAATTT